MARKNVISHCLKKKKNQKQIPQTKVDKVVNVQDSNKTHKGMNNSHNKLKWMLPQKKKKKYIFGVLQLSFLSCSSALKVLNPSVHAAPSAHIQHSPSTRGPWLTNI